MAASNPKIRSYAGFILFLGLALYQYNQQSEFNFFFALFIGLRFLSLAIIYLFREPPRKETSVFQQVIAYIGAALPFLYSSEKSILWTFPNNLSILTMVGSLVSIWGILSLGKSFAITPARRSIVTSGAYKIFKHPIYTGYALAELAIILTFFSIFNLIIFLTSMTLYVVRSKWEERILALK